MTTTFLLDYLPIAASVFLTVCYLPQIIKTYRTKDVSGISLPFWVFLNVALSLMLVNSIVIFIEFGTWGYMVTEIIKDRKSTRLNSSHVAISYAVFCLKKNT